MKKWLVLGLCVLFSLNGFSQTVDTLGIVEYRNGTPTVYTSPNGGFAFGNNGYGDKVKAQSFEVETMVTLTEVLIEFGEVIYGSVNPQSLVNINIYDNYGPGILVGSGSIRDSVAPDSILASIAVPVSALMDNGSFTVVDFSSNPMEFTESFSIGIDFAQLSMGDTVGLVSTTDGEPFGNNDAWELTSDSVWFQMAESSYSWGLDVQLAIFPVVEVDEEPASIDDKLISAVLYPNPCSEFLNLNFLKAGIYDVELSDAIGRMVYSTSTSEMTNSLDVSGLEPGAYVVSISDKLVHSSYTIIKE